MFVGIVSFCAEVPCMKKMAVFRDLGISRKYLQNAFIPLAVTIHNYSSFYSLLEYRKRYIMKEAAMSTSRSSTSSQQQQQQDRKQRLMHECAVVEDIIRRIVQQNNLESNSRPSLDESPLKPWIIEMAKTVLVFETTTTSMVYGTMTGHGVLLKRLPSTHPSLIKWSSPLFVKIRARGGGLMFGKQQRLAFAVCTTTQLEDALLHGPDSATNGHSFKGIEFELSCGAGNTDKTNILSIPIGNSLDLVCVSQMSGAMFGCSLLSGSMRIDLEKNESIYGTDMDVGTILTEDIPAPQEFQPLYGELNRIVNRVEKVSMNAARVSASLERFSTGRDPERVLVLEDGTSITS